MPNRSPSAFAYVLACFGERNTLRDTTLPPAVGMNTSETFAPWVPALKRFSSVRHEVPLAPPTYVATETSARYGTTDATVICFDALAELVAFEALSVTVYVPGPA